MKIRLLALITLMVMVTGCGSPEPPGQEVRQGNTYITVSGEQIFHDEFGDIHYPHETCRYDTSEGEWFLIYCENSYLKVYRYRDSYYITEVLMSKD